MSTQPSSSPSPDAQPAVALFPLSVAPPEVPVAEASAAGGTRKLSRWEEQEEIWFPEETDFSHSGINE
ncbi:MAG: hypothetical protein ABMA26_17815 [Limisphaerales bacterium]